MNKEFFLKLYNNYGKLDLPKSHGGEDADQRTTGRDLQLDQDEAQHDGSQPGTRNLRNKHRFRGR